MRISDWSSDVCSSDLITEVAETLRRAGCRVMFLDGSFVTDKELPEDFDGCWDAHGVNAIALDPVLLDFEDSRARQKEKFGGERSEEHTSELQSLMRISYAVFCLKKKTIQTHIPKI